jgi:hypothetical protein
VSTSGFWYRSPPVGPILDLAVLALTLVVVGSLGLLAWTIGVTATRRVEAQRRRLTDVRESIADLRGRLEPLEGHGGRE